MSLTRVPSLWGVLLPIQPPGVPLHGVWMIIPPCWGDFSFSYLGATEYTELSTVHSTPTALILFLENDQCFEKRTWIGSLWVYLCYNLTRLRVHCRVFFRDVLYLSRRDACLQLRNYEEMVWFLWHQQATHCSPWHLFLAGSWLYLHAE